METKYNHLQVEEGKNKKWIEKEYFSTHDAKKKPFSIILPPPNVTGKLHLGHAWDGFIQDTLIRYKKLKGFDVLWVPGMDHAGIATQAKVEEKLRNENQPTRFELGREAFLDKVWEWKEDYASTIRQQWGTLGLALDYKNERFTMDGGLTDAVQKVFIKMYNDKLIYRGTRAINWDPQLQTVLSNIEVISKDTESRMYYIKYPLGNSFVEVATTRPETMFSDVAIAVNPNDEKMSELIGSTAKSPLTGEELPIIGDDYIEVGKGTGAMKVSAHATADIDIIQNNGMEINECIDEFGKMNNLAGEFKGLDRFVARDKVAEKLEAGGFITKVETITNAVGYSERSGVAVETLMSPQWFVNMDPLAKKMLKDMASEEGVEFFPGRFEDVMKTWMDDVHDWCISRQLWWGHRIPAWYKGDDIKVQIESPGEGWSQDDDVLDTWFSSGIAPFSFLGWPQDDSMQDRYYPTSLLVTGYDIIFFWVARMYFQSLEFKEQKPFSHVLLHGLIRAEDGRKMSKSLGNGIDPMETVEKYGSDSLRWFLLTNSTPGNDIRYSPQKIEAAWNLNNKLWNISRYILEVMEDGNGEVSDADKWITNKLIDLEKLIEQKMDTYEFTVIGKELNKFIMEDFSSWYIEFTKATPNKKVATEILKKLLVILHPFLPFVTDHIYTLIGEELLEQEITPPTQLGDADYINRVIDIVKAIRDFRESSQISNSTPLGYEPSLELPDAAIAMIKQLVNADIEQNNDAVVPAGKITISIKLTEEMKEAEQQRVEKMIKHFESEIKRAKGMLANENFVSKAPADKIEAEKSKLANFESQLEELKSKNNF